MSLSAYLWRCHWMIHQPPHRVFRPHMDTRPSTNIGTVLVDYMNDSKRVEHCCQAGLIVALLLTMGMKRTVTITLTVVFLAAGLPAGARPLPLKQSHSGSRSATVHKRTGIRPLTRRTRATTPKTGKFVFTGGPGVGKTTIINALTSKGYVGVPEAARHIIASEQKKVDRAQARGKTYKGVLPWTDLAGFQHRVVRQQSLWETLARSKALQGRGKTRPKGTVLDRSFVDPVAYMLEAGMSPKTHPVLFKKLFSKIKKAGYQKVFVLDQLPHYANDAQRKESADQAGKLHNRLFDVYRDMGKRYGFDVVRVPAVGVEQRVNFVLDQMKR